MMDRTWIEAANFEKYEVSNDGLMRNKRPRSDRPELLKGSPDKDGYIRYALRADGKTWNRISHRIVWESFVGPIPPGMQINHKNGVKNDNRLENLEVMTPSQNVLHSFRVLGKKPCINPNPGTKNGRAKLNDTSVREIRTLIQTGLSDKTIAARFGVSPASIWFIKTKQTWTSVA